MSIETFVALCGDLPDRDLLDELLADRGGVQGTWQTDLQSGGVSIHVDDDRLPSLRDTLSRTRKPLEISRALVLTGGSFDDVEEIGTTLLTLTGGALLTEDGDVIATKRAPAKAKPKPRARGPALDTTIPFELAVLLDGRQDLFTVCGRTPPTVKPAAIVRAIPSPPEGIGYHRLFAWHGLRIGRLVLKHRSDTGYVLSFEYWHHESAPPGDWRAMVHFSCGLARHMQGLIVGSTVRHDFAPALPVPSWAAG